MTVDRDVLTSHVRMAERWREIAAAETSVTRCQVCRDCLTVDELRRGWTCCLRHQETT